MLMEKELEARIAGALGEIEALSGAEIVGSRQPSASGTVKGEKDQTAKAVVAVAVGFRSHDDFSLTPVSIPVTVAITTRAEMDATGETHEKMLEAVAGLLSDWHRDGGAMTSALSSGKLFAGELRMTGGSGKQYDSARSAWVESVSFTIRGAERFTTED